MAEILIRDLMRTNVPVMQTEATLAMVVAEMAQHSLSCMIIVDQAESLLGIVTERDLVAISALALDGKLDWQEPAVEHMSAQLVCVRPEQSLFEALVIARAREVRHLPVVNDDNTLAGLVTATELIRAHFSVFESQREAAEKAVAVFRENQASTTARLRILSLEDPLLGIGNRRALERDLEQTESASQRYQHVYSLAMFDVDRFKKYNDEYGHPAGDRMLRKIVEVFTESLRSADRLYRYGGEEILLLMPETPLPGAKLVADRLRASLEAHALPHSQTQRGIVTVSGGVAEGGFRHEPAGWDAVVQAADSALYRAKKGGRNKVVAAASGMPASAQAQGIRD